MKKIIAFLTAIVLVFCFAGCSQNSDNAGDTTQNTAASQAESTQVSYPLTIEDQAGRSVVIEEEPKTIVSGYYITTSILISLGQQDKLVGIEAKANTRNIYSLSAEKLLSLPSVGTAKQFDLEQCAALNPDIVILPAKLESVVPSLEELGITAVIVNPESTELMRETVTILSQALNCVDKGNALLDYADNAISELKNEVGADNKDVKPSVYFAGNSSYLSTAGSKMYQNSLIENTGAVNVAAEIEDTYWAEISYEQLITWNPEYIIIASDAEYTAEDLMNDENLASLDAVKNGKVYQLPDDFESWDSPVPSNFLGSIYIASKIHPDKVSTDYLKNEVSEFYSEFYGFTADTSVL